MEWRPVGSAGSQVTLGDLMHGCNTTSIQKWHVLTNTAQGKNFRPLLCVLARGLSQRCPPAPWMLGSEWGSEWLQGRVGVGGRCSWTLPSKGPFVLHQWWSEA